MVPHAGLWVQVSVDVINTYVYKLLFDEIAE